MGVGRRKTEDVFVRTNRKASHPYPTWAYMKKNDLAYRWTLLAVRCVSAFLALKSMQ